MLVKSNSVPNFLFETPKTKEHNLKLILPKIIPYSDFINNNNKNNQKINKSEGRNAITNCYTSDTLYHSGLSLPFFHEAIFCFSSDI